MATVVNPKFVAPKPAAPAAPKTSYNTPAVIAKPAAPATKPASGGYSGIPSSNFTYGSGNPQYVAPVKKVTGGSSSNQATIDAANKQLLSDQKLLNELLNQYVAGNTGGGAPSGGGDTIINPGNRSDASYIEEGRSGTSNTGKRYIEGRLVSESEWNTFLYGDNKGTGGSTPLASTTPERTLALDTFKATLGLLFGKDEVNKAYVGKLYSLVSGFYKTGSEVDEAINLALYQAESENAIPEFTSQPT
jgi:hypothetical protein